jgi:hypothetical protein
MESRASQPGHDALPPSNRCSKAGSLRSRRAHTENYGRFASGALKYFSIGISKYISSEPFASRTPVR